MRIQIDPFAQPKAKLKDVPTGRPFITKQSNYDANDGLVLIRCKDSTGRIGTAQRGRHCSPVMVLGRYASAASARTPGEILTLEDETPVLLLGQSEAIQFHPYRQRKPADAATALSAARENGRMERLRHSLRQTIREYTTPMLVMLENMSSVVASQFASHLPEHKLLDVLTVAIQAEVKARLSEPSKDGRSMS